MDAAAQGGELISTSGVTSPWDQAAVRNLEHGSGHPIPVIELYGRDLRNKIPNWPHALVLFMRTPIPYFDDNYNITHFPFAHSGYFPLYTSHWEANYRTNLHGAQSFSQITIQIPLQDPAFGYDSAVPSIANGQTWNVWQPDLPAADATTDPKDFSRKWDPVNGIAHPGYTESPINLGINFNDLHYDHEGNLL